jgi:hypothetical protein
MMESENEFGKAVAKVCGINLGILVLYSLFWYAFGEGGGPYYVEFIFGMVVSVALQSTACFVAGIVFFAMGRKPYGMAFLLASLLVGILGFSFCYGGLALLS